MAALAPALRTLSGSITHLDLHGCRLAAEGAAALAAAFEHLTSLTHLDLRDNQLTGPGFGALAQALAPLHSLQHLHLGANVISSDEVAAPLAAALLGPMSLTFLAVTVRE